MRGLPAQAEGEVHFLPLVVLFGPSRDWMMPSTLGRGGSYLLSLPTKCSSVPKTPSVTHSHVLPALWAPLSLIKLTYQVNHHTHLHLGSTRCLQSWSCQWSVIEICLSSHFGCWGTRRIFSRKRAFLPHQILLCGEGLYLQGWGGGQRREFLEHFYPTPPGLLCSESLPARRLGAGWKPGWFGWEVSDPPTSSSRGRLLQWLHLPYWRDHFPFGGWV